MKKRLEIAVDSINWTKNAIIFHTVVQSHDFTKFGESEAGHSFCAANGVILASWKQDDRRDCRVESRSLEIYPGHKMNLIFRMGEFDSTIMYYCTIVQFVRILEAIAEYNAYEFPDKKHKIVIDGSKIEISDESFKALKASIKTYLTI